MDLLLVLDATEYAAKVHVKQMRKLGHEPYVNHLIRVANQAAKAGLTTKHALSDY